MSRWFRSTPAASFERGLEFGQIHAEKIAANWARYRQLFARVAQHPYDLDALGRQALLQIEAFDLALHQELCGMAEGAQLAAEHLAALNARTEILALLGAQQRGECSTLVWANPWGAPVTAQTWDWYLEFTEGWLIWEIPHPSGHLTRTVTEYGILGKIGVNKRGLGVHFNILHHEEDGRSGQIGVPLHLLSRHLLDAGYGFGNAALQCCTQAKVSASSVLTLVGAADNASAAVSVELYSGGSSLVFPETNGLLIHTNHFLAAAPAACDTEPAQFADTLIRYDLLRRRLYGRDRFSEEALREALDCRLLGQEGALNCQPCDASSAPWTRYATLATVSLNVAAGEIDVFEGGPDGLPIQPGEHSHA